MKKLFLSLMLIAGFATGFTSCDDNKTNEENTTHSQTFTLGETSYHVDNAISILNIQYQGSDAYNTIILSEGDMIEEEGGEGHGVIIIFDDDITTGTYEFSDDETSYPKYFIAQVNIEDIVNFDPANYEDNEDAYMAISGAMTIEEVDGKYVITTDGIEVRNYKDDTTETSSVDYEGATHDFTLATVDPESEINGSPIVTAGLTSPSYEAISGNLLAFFSEDGKLFGLISFDSWNGTIPEGTITVDGINPLLYLDFAEIEEVNASVLLSHLLYSGTVNIEKEGDMYIVDIQSGNNTLHYKGTLPYFDFFF